MDTLKVRTRHILLTVGEIIQFFLSFARSLFRHRWQWRTIATHSHVMGVGSLGLVGLTGFITGFVLTLQSRPTLADFGAEAMVPAMVTISVFREIGPVITSLICAGKIGSRIAAEIGAMRVTDQIDAMQVSVISPMDHLIFPRVIAATVIIPLLVFYANLFALLGAFGAFNLHESASVSLFLHLSIGRLEFFDVIPSLLKSMVFGFLVGLISCYYGYSTQGGTSGVGSTTNSAVVSSSVAIFIVDLLVVQIGSFLH